MPEWKHHLRGLRRHITDDTSAAGVNAAALGVTGVLREFAASQKKSLAKHGPGTIRLDEYDLERLDEIIEEMTDAGEAGDLEWFNNVLAVMYDFCDANLIWVEYDRPETGV